MKKFILFFCGMLMLVGSANAVDFTSVKESIPSEQRYVVFRTTQKMRANSGDEIYFYFNRTCKMYDSNGRLMVTCTYRISDGEVLLLDERGNEVYKGSYRMSSDRINLSWVKFAGVTYWKK